MSERPSPPNAVKRELRQEAGFGCCICGLPVIEYHHIVPWEVERHFRPADMMVLCPNHHRQATADAFSVPDQREFKAKPFNMTMGQPGGLLQFGPTRERPTILIGSDLELKGDGCVLAVDGEGLLELRRGEQNRPTSTRLGAPRIEC